MTAEEQHKQENNRILQLLEAILEGQRKTRLQRWLAIIGIPGVIVGTVVALVVPFSGYRQWSEERERRSEVQGQLHEYAKEAEHLLVVEEDYEGAEVLIEEALRIAPDHEDATRLFLYIRSRRAVVRGHNLSGIISELKIFTQRHPDDHIMNLALGQVYHTLDRHEAVLEVLAKIPDNVLPDKKEVDRFFLLAASRRHLVRENDPPLHNLIESQQYAQRGLQIAQETDDIVGQAELLNEIGLGVKQLNKLKEAKETFSEVLALMEPFAPRNSILRIRLTAYRGIAACHWLEKEFVEARQSYASVLGIIEELRDKPAKAKSLTNIGLIWMDEAQEDQIQADEKRRRIQQGIAKLNESLVMKKEVGLSQQSTLTHLCRGYALLGDEIQALEYYARAQSKTQKGNADQWYNLESAHVELLKLQGRTEEAEQLDQELREWAIRNRPELLADEQIKKEQHDQSSGS